MFLHHLLKRYSSVYRLLVEKIFAQYMVPHSLDTEEKMKCLYYLYACLDTNAVKSVNLLLLNLFYKCMYVCNN